MASELVAKLVHPLLILRYKHLYGLDRRESPPSQASNTKNRQVVLNLYSKGIFDSKDTINQVVDRSNISKHTVYLYIRQLRHKEFPEGEE